MSEQSKTPRTDAAAFSVVWMDGKLVRVNARDFTTADHADRLERELNEAKLLESRLAQELVKRARVEQERDALVGNLDKAIGALRVVTEKMAHHILDDALDQARQTLRELVETVSREGAKGANEVGPQINTD